MGDFETSFYCYTVSGAIETLLKYIWVDDKVGKVKETNVLKAIDCTP